MKSSSYAEVHTFYSSVDSKISLVCWVGVGVNRGHQGGGGIDFLVGGPV